MIIRGRTLLIGAFAILCIALGALLTLSHR